MATRTTSGSDPGASLDAAEIARLAAAIASPRPRAALLEAVQAIASARMAVTVFSASACSAETLELERIHSSRPDVYASVGRKSKRGTSCAQQVLIERRIFVGEGPLEMAAAFDDQEQMGRVGFRSIINVPIVFGDRCVGVLSFGRDSERVAPHEILLARLLGVAASAAFVVGAGSP